jgi:hypothetical protein
MSNLSPEKLKVGIVYSIAQKVRRRCIVLDHPGAINDELEHHKALLLPGEGWLEIDDDHYHTLNHQGLTDHIANIIGEPTSHRHVIIDDEDRVVHVVGFDPAIDMVDGKHRNTDLEKAFGGMRIVQHDEALHGNIYKSGKFSIPE